ncbi:hypothetical protein [Streptomyces violaceusniger]|uniref:Uncharacterized protein n=1 Tax=Streptomyces violaceusniger (strain Tu 4113) TaxID=653045 RepID=G2NU85_STRV4|nr:hypothetical protein [Streptomyces violaceusniger]AEM84119.1 hypothetical protein Strvi_4504 [Streptomyces violaceusniger Tu 4113]
MGNRQQQNARKKKARAQHAARRFLFPSDDEPLPEVRIEDEASASVNEMCLKYWGLTKLGERTYKVADLGSSAQVSRTVKETCSSIVLALLCPQCDSPVTAWTRSDLATWRNWHVETFRRQQRVAEFPCEQCYEAAARTRRRIEQGQARRAL